jgi:trigger factor
MLTNTNSQYVNPTFYAADFLVDKDTYQSLSTRITDQYLKNIEVPGFRKGHAPRNIAEKKSDPIYLENLIYNEVINRSFPEAEKILRDNMEKEGQAILSIGLSQEPETIGDDNGGFKFRLVCNLLPKVDLTPIENLEIAKSTEADLPTRISKDEFYAREKDAFVKTFNDYEEADVKLATGYRAVADIDETNDTEATETRSSKDVILATGVNQFPEDFEKQISDMKAGETKEFTVDIRNTQKNEMQKLTFKVTIKSVQKPKYKTIDEIFENVDFVKKNYGSADAFTKNLETTYDQETENLLRDAQLKKAMGAIVEATGEVEIVEDDVKMEIERIFNEFQKNLDPVATFNDSYFPFAGKATKATLKKEIEKYVRGEFKMARLCLVIYYLKVQDKVTEEELDKYVKEISTDPAKYGYSKDTPKPEIKDKVFDNLLRNKSYNWILTTVKFN